VGGGVFFLSPSPLSSLYLIMCSKDISLSQIFKSEILPENPFLHSLKHLHWCTVQKRYIAVQFDTHTFLYSSKHVHCCTVQNTYIPVQFDTYTSLYSSKTRTLLFSPIHIHSCTVRYTYIPVQFNTRTFLYSSKHVHCCTVQNT